MSVPFQECNLLQVDANFKMWMTFINRRTNERWYDSCMGSHTKIPPDVGTSWDWSLRLPWRTQGVWRWDVSRCKELLMSKTFLCRGFVRGHINTKLNKFGKCLPQKRRPYASGARARASLWQRRCVARGPRYRCGHSNDSQANLPVPRFGIGK